MGVGAVEKGLRFALERDPDLPCFVAVDAGKLRQVLLNLLGNAIKYTDSGGVKLTARLARGPTGPKKPKYALRWRIPGQAYPRRIASASSFLSCS
jgi:signal transduction histidine kinase